jgi:hypothetical protein
MPMLVVAAVLDAAIATPSRMPSERLRSGWSAIVDFLLLGRSGCHTQSGPRVLVNGVDISALSCCTQMP